MKTFLADELNFCTDMSTFYHSMYEKNNISAHFASLGRRLAESHRTELEKAQSELF